MALLAQREAEAAALRATVVALRSSRRELSLRVHLLEAASDTARTSRALAAKDAEISALRFRIAESSSRNLESRLSRARDFVFDSRNCLGAPPGVAPGLVSPTSAERAPPLPSPLAPPVQPPTSSAPLVAQPDCGSALAPRPSGPAFSAPRALPGSALHSLLADVRSVAAASPP